MKVTPELLNELQCPSTPVKHDGKWVVATEFRAPKYGEIYFDEASKGVRDASYDLDFCFVIFTPCELPPRPDAETVKRLTPAGMTLTVNVEPDLESVPYVNTYSQISDDRSHCLKDVYHGLRYGVVITPIAKEPEVEYYRHNNAETYIKTIDGASVEAVEFGIVSKPLKGDVPCRLCAEITAAEYEAAITPKVKAIEPLAWGNGNEIINKINELVKAVNEMKGAK